MRGTAAAPGPARALETYSAPSGRTGEVLTILGTTDTPLFRPLVEGFQRLWPHVTVAYEEGETLPIYLEVAEARAALETGYGTSPVDIGVGGSIPFIADLVSEFPAAQILVTGVEDPHARAHSPNESLHLDTFRRALLSEALLLESLDATR